MLSLSIGCCSEPPVPVIPPCPRSFRALRQVRVGEHIYWLPASPLTADEYSDLMDIWAWVNATEAALAAE
jgi:hypothetical protein